MLEQITRPRAREPAKFRRGPSHTPRLPQPSRDRLATVLTLELRWFMPGTVSDRELRSFAGDGRVEDRTDRYLLGTGDELGIKRRGAAGLVEHKRRLAQTPVSVPREGSPLIAVVERWLKSWPDGDSSDGVWVAVAKRRARRRVGSCRAELTLLRIEALADSHLSLAIETTHVDACDELLRSTKTLLRSHPQLVAGLDGAESCGYPAWLRARWDSNPRPSG
jgi:hypothetical protein